MKPISEAIRNNIVALLNSGRSSRKIASQLGVGHSTVDRVRSTMGNNTPKCRAGRPSKLSANTKRWLVRAATSDKVETATQMARELCNTMDVKVSSETVRHTLKQAGLKSAVKKKRPRLLARHKKARLDFAKTYKDWTVEDWKRVVWSDETKINRLGSDGRQWVWKKPGSGLQDHHVQGTVKFGGGSLMLWGCMTAKGVGFATKIDGGMDAALYVSILEDELLKSLEYYGLGKDEVVFQQDNDPKHRSRLAREWFENNGIELLDWPAQSPDLNPIEHLWCHLKQKLNGYENEASSILELWQRVQKEWNDIPIGICIGLIESMPRRVAAVLKAKGGYTKY